MEHVNKKQYFFHLATTTIHILFIALFFLFLLFGYKKGIFTNDQYMKDFLKTKHAFAPFFFIFIQIVQVIFPIIPGGATCIMGVLLFGPTMGFLYNYIGLTIGSMLAFFLSKKYGYSIIHLFFQEKSIRKYTQLLQKKNFQRFFVWAIILPGAPDDLLCYLIGLTPIQTERFCKIILLGKPICLLGYSLGFLFLPSLF